MKSYDAGSFDLNVLSSLERLTANLWVHYQTHERIHEAFAYRDNFLGGKDGGGSVWHAILDDAIKMRKELDVC